MCYCPTPTLHLNLALTGDGAFLFSLKKTYSVWFISVLNYGDTENVLINHLLLVIPMSYPCHYTNLCPHKPHKHAHTHTHTHTLTGHFIRYTLLVLGWTLFFLQNCLNSPWNRFNKMLETFLRDFGPYWHDSITQLLQICRLHIHDANLPFHHIPRCSIGLRSGDCGGHLSKVNSLSCSRNQSEMIWALWHQKMGTL